MQWIQNHNVHSIGELLFKIKSLLEEVATLIYFWARQYPVTDAAEKAEVDINTAIDIYQWLREVP